MNLISKFYPKKFFFRRFFIFGVSSYLILNIGTYIQRKRAFKIMRNEKEKKLIINKELNENFSLNIYDINDNYFDIKSLNNKYVILLKSKHSIFLNFYKQLNNYFNFDKNIIYIYICNNEKTKWFFKKLNSEGNENSKICYIKNEDIKENNLFLLNKEGKLILNEYLNFVDLKFSTELIKSKILKEKNKEFLERFRNN